MNDVRVPGGSFGRLRRVGEACLWALVIGVAAVAMLWAAARLRLVVLPVLLALVLATLLSPPVDWLRRRGWADALATVAVLAGALALLAAVVALIVPRAVDDFGELDVGLSGGLDRIQDWLTEGPLGLSETQIDDALTRLREQVRDNTGGLTSGALSGAFVLLEVLTGLVLAVVVLFFFLKDGERMWRWVSDLAPSQWREDVREAGGRGWQALAGFLRGQTIVALFDAVFIGLALVIIGVPLVLPLVVMTFFGAYVPIIGASIAGLAAALVALFDGGPLAALLVIGAILVVQQVEGNVLQPYVVGRSVKVHPLAILLGITTGGVLGGIIGAMVAAPLVAVGAAVLRYAREPRPASGGGAARDDDERPAAHPRQLE